MMYKKINSKVLVLLAASMLSGATAVDAKALTSDIGRLTGDGRQKNTPSVEPVSPDVNRISRSLVDQYGNRSMVVFVPATLPPSGQRSMVIALHGGSGNAAHLQQSLNIDDVAEKNGFIVAYLNGTQAASNMPDYRKSWNAGGGCCGLPVFNKIDDVGYITQATSYLAQKYGVDARKVYVTGHSNGSLMAQMMLCKTNVFQAGVTIAGPLAITEQSCPAAANKRILAIHGTEDRNVPINGGRGTEGATNVVFRSEVSAQALFKKSGATYDLNALAGTAHELNDIAAYVQSNEGTTLGQKISSYLGLAKSPSPKTKQ